MPEQKRPVLVYVTEEERRALQCLADDAGHTLSQEGRAAIRARIAQSGRICERPSQPGGKPGATG